jgi:cytidine deaminase
MPGIQKTVRLQWQEFAAADALAPYDQQLLQEAKKAIRKAYAPYSHFRVGAAIRLANGEVLSGANQENAAYPMCLCAERVALGAAAALYPEVPVVAMAITIQNERQTIDRPGAPCGACRQVMVETEECFGQDFPVLLQGETGPILRINRAKDLLPLYFDGTYL